MDYRELARQHRLTQETAIAAKVEKKVRLAQEEQAKKLLEHQKELAKARETLKYLDMFGVVEMLNGINNDIWEGKGVVGVDELIDKSTELPTGKMVTLKTVIHDARPKTRYVYREVYGPFTVSRIAYSPGGDGYSYHDYVGWHKQAIGERVIGLDWFDRSHSISVNHETNASTGLNKICVRDDTFNLEAYRLEGFEFIDRTYRPPTEPANKTYTYTVSESTPTPFHPSEIGIVFDRDGINTDLANQLIRFGLLSHASRRLEKPLSIEFESARINLESIRSQMGSVINRKDPTDPTPAWRRLLNPIREID